jgi:hypothetical protein
MEQPVVAVVLEPDVAAVFDSSTKVNARLRSIIAERKKSTHATKATPDAAANSGLTRESSRRAADRERRAAHSQR